MNILEQVEKIAFDSGFSEYDYVKIDDLKYYQEVRTICEGNSCRNYAASWACPPAVGTLSECKERVEQYDNMLLFTRKYEVEDSFDFEGMQAGLRNFKQTVNSFQLNLNSILPTYLLLSNEDCGRYSECTYPNAPCRFSQLLHHSLEGYGFIVKELADNAGVRYNNGPNTVTFFGALLFNVINHI